MKMVPVRYLLRKMKIPDFTQKQNRVQTREPVSVSITSQEQENTRDSVYA